MIIEFMGDTPEISEKAFCAPDAAIIGDVTISEDASIWFGSCPLRGVNLVWIKKLNLQSLYINLMANLLII